MSSKHPCHYCNRHKIFHLTDIKGHSEVCKMPVINCSTNTQRLINLNSLSFASLRRRRLVSPVEWQIQGRSLPSTETQRRLIENTSVSGTPEILNSQICDTKDEVEEQTMATLKNVATFATDSTANNLIFIEVSEYTTTKPENVGNDQNQTREELSKEKLGQRLRTISKRLGVQIPLQELCNQNKKDRVYETMSKVSHQEKLLGVLNKKF